MIIVDTMALSEPFKPRPGPDVVNWLDRQIPSDLFVTSISQAELEYGLWGCRQANGEAGCGAESQNCSESIFFGRVLPFDSRTALMFGTNIALARQKHGKDAVNDMDGMIATIAISHDRCRVAARDRNPFESMGVEVVGPWTEKTEETER